MRSTDDEDRCTTVRQLQQAAVEEMAVDYGKVPLYRSRALRILRCIDYACAAQLRR